MKFDVKVAVITGASSGIGAETARHFARPNATLVLVDKNDDGLALVVSDVEKLKVKHLLIQADLTQDDDVATVVQKTVSHFGRLDILLNIAGVYERGPFQDSSMEQFDRLHSLNIRAVYALTLACTPHLIASKGVIINMSRWFEYDSSRDLSRLLVDKSRRRSYLTKCLAVELGPKGVRVNSINPGPTETPLFDYFGSKPETVLSASAEKSPLKRLGLPSDIAKAAVYITGVNLKVDGAITLT